MKFLFQIITVLMLTISAQANKTVVIMVPNDFMWPEYQIPKALYEKAGFKVVVAGKSKEDLKPDRRNQVDYPESMPIKPDMTFDEITAHSFDAITFVGGNGSWHDFFPNTKVHDLLKKSLAENKVVGLLCASTGLLGLAGNFNGTGGPLAKGKTVVGYYKVEGILKSLGRVNFVEGNPDEVTAVRDGNLITGRNPQSSQKFAEEVIKAVLERKSKAQSSLSKI